MKGAKSFWGLVIKGDRKMINEIKRRLEAGEAVELECIDVDAISASNRSYAETLLGSQLILSHVFANKVIFKNRLFIYEPELKYFKIKENKKTFYDLVDVAVQAKKDGAISHFEWNSQGALYVYHLTDGDPIVLARDGVSSDFVEDAIKTIKSCYTETFVIESEKDIKKIKKGAGIQLSNGNEDIVDLVLADDKRIHLSESNQYGAVGIFVLKGATVTQRRVNE